MDNPLYNKLRRKYIIAIVAIILLITTALFLDINKAPLVTKEQKSHLDSVDKKYVCWQVTVNTARISNMYDAKINYDILVVDYVKCNGQYSPENILNNSELADKEANLVFKNLLVDKKQFKEIELRFSYNSKATNYKSINYRIDGDSLVRQN